MAAQTARLFTPQEYLEFERASEGKHEYVHGAIVAMAGGTVTHDRVAGNVYSLLREAVAGTPCEVFTANMRVQTTATHYCYADASVACGSILVEDAEQDTLLNPVHVVEVISKSTESYDRGLKFQLYKSIASVREYLLIHQTIPRIERYTRTDSGDWIRTEFAGLDSTLSLDSIACTLVLTAAYERINFSPSAVPAS